MEQQATDPLGAGVALTHILVAGDLTVAEVCGGYGYRLIWRGSGPGIAVVHAGKWLIYGRPWTGRPYE